MTFCFFSFLLFIFSFEPKLPPDLCKLLFELALLTATRKAAQGPLDPEREIILTSEYAGLGCIAGKVGGKGDSWMDCFDVSWMHKGCDSRRPESCERV